MLNFQNVTWCIVGAYNGGPSVITWSYESSYFRYFTSMVRYSGL